MKTIRERALARYPIHCDEDFECEVIAPLRGCYVKAATEQRDIDIQKACNWLDEHIHDYLHCDGPMEPYYIGDQSLIEDFRKAMKGE